MLQIKNIISILIVGLFLTACGSDRAGSIASEDNGSRGVLGVVDIDSDGDGITDIDEENIYGTNPQSKDTDNDGLLDNEEINTYDTNVANPDTDGDGLLDGEEINTYDTNVTNPDTDGDGLLDGEEINTYDTNVTNPDTDGDGLVDGEEINTYDTNATNSDTDGDGLLDGEEINTYDTNATNSDTDGDSLLDGEEINTYDTNATNPDTDGDSLLDGEEINTYDTNATNPDTDADGLLDGEEINTYDTNATNPDTDGDSLLDGEEINTYDTNATNPDTDADGLLDGEEINTYDTNATNSDTDNDGLLDADEINIYNTNANSSDTDGDGLFDGEEIKTQDMNATNSDTDGDGLLDGEEINTYGTNPISSDTDNDGLSDADEINMYDTNATNPDTDGDCLLDSFEILNYETNATNPDTDGDSVNDGVEVYSYDTNELNVSCLSSPETLDTGHNTSPAKDALPDLTTDIINVLDPSNDSDGDGQSNTYENNCTEGDALDTTQLCEYIMDSEIGQILTSHGYSYVPGGFDVDGDGINEGGFWISRYQARSSGIEIGSEDVISDVGNVNQYLSKKFKVLNRNIDVLSYNEALLGETDVVAGTELVFDEESVAGIERISDFTPYLAEVCLSRYVLNDANGDRLDIDITMPTHKQYMHVKMLLDADLVTPNANGLLGDGRHIRNGVLGIDPNVPLFSYNLIIDEFGEDLKEYVRNLVQLRQTVNTNSFVDTFTFADDVPEWWEANSTKFKAFDTGANSTQNLGHGIGPEKDSYAVIVRGGAILNVTQGVSGALTDDAGQTNGISFRAATDYLY
ncbi:MAG: internalin, putative [uncultured Sulfurovum sp.]|uniref:Internalin, putative n=1 Tax=uncultured Sulfurovum sp. TaxID=269237 RepID=A0A6S6SQT1_9BACT|nr:MAG: internalin, putative [uncultured Sulfurovum sp.]